MKKLFFFLPCIIITHLQAQPGSLDPNFANAGIALGFFSQNYNFGMGIHQQTDGKLLNVGTIADAFSLDNIYMLRYLSDGSLDSSFGFNGVIIDSTGNGDDQAFDVIQQPNSKILLVGSFDNPVERDVFIRQYDSTGVLDSGFGNGGMVTTDFQNGSDDGGFRVKLQTDGKIIVCGPSTETVNYTTGIMLLRYNTDGSLDSTFGNAGKVLFDQLIGDQYVSQFILQADGKILVVGVTEDANGDFDILTVRFLLDGSLDNSFNGDGIFTFDMSGSDDEGWAIAQQQDGKILIGGMGVTMNGADDLLIRLDSSGYPDMTFNSTGILTKDHNLSYDYITSILIQPDQRIITVGQSADFTEKISLSRYLSNGADDISFGSGGSIIHSWSVDDLYSHSAILQSDNYIVITGSMESSNVSNNYVARFENDSLFTAIPDINLSNSKIYPNPVYHRLFLHEINPGSVVTIFNSNGQVVCQQKMESNSLDVSFLPIGMYLLKMENSKGYFVQKFIRE